MQEDICQLAKKQIHIMYDSLMEQSNKSAHLLNITDVLKQVYLTIDKSNDPAVLLSRLVKYIYVEGFSRINLSKEAESALIELGHLSKDASWNGMNQGNFTDKSQFYSIFENIPQR